MVRKDVRTPDKIRKNATVPDRYRPDPVVSPDGRLFAHRR